MRKELMQVCSLKELAAAIRCVEDRACTIIYRREDGGITTYKFSRTGEVGWVRDRRRNSIAGRVRIGVPKKRARPPTNNSLLNRGPYRKD